MYDEEPFTQRFLNIIGWINGVLISIIISLSLITRTITFPYINEMWEIVIGWTILMLTIIGVVIKIVTIIKNKN